MFNLEQSISEWRKQMLADGIKTPVPLNELESHLREDIEQQIKLGSNTRDAFNSAVQKLGQPVSLKSEFKQTGNIYGFLSERRTLSITLISRVIGLIWLTFYGVFFLKSGFSSWLTPLDFKALLIGSIFLNGLFGSILLMLGSKWGKGIIRVNALVFVFMCIIQVCFITEYSTRLGIFATFCIVSIWLLHLPQQKRREILE